MAMNLRLSDEDTILLRQLAEAEHVTLTEMVRRSLHDYAARRAHSAEVRSAAREGLARYGDLLDRLGRA